MYAIDCAEPFAFARVGREHCAKPSLGKEDEM